MKVVLACCQQVASTYAHYFAAFLLVFFLIVWAVAGRVLVRWQLDVGICSE